VDMVRFGRLALAALALALAGCADTSFAPGLKVSLPGEVSVQQGGSVEVKATVEPTGGFQGEVKVSLEGAPAGVSLSPTSFQVKGAVKAQQALTLSVAEEVPPSTYDLQVRFSNPSIGERKAGMRLTVLPRPDFDLSLSPGSLEVRAGESGKVRLTLTPRNGFRGVVDLSLENAPPGVSLSPASVSVEGAGPVGQDLTLSVGEGVPPGTYALRVKAASGRLSKAADLTLSVLPRPDLSLDVSPRSAGVVQGQSLTLTLSFTSQSGFQGQVGLEMTEGGKAPTWLSFSPTSVALDVPKGGERSLTLNLQVSPNAPTGTHALKLRAVHKDGAAERDLTLTVSPPPDFTISLDPTSLTVQQGGSGTAQLTLTPRNGFAGTVSLALERPDGTAPSGITLSPTSVSVSGTSPVVRTLYVGVGTSVPTGSHHLRLKATSGSLTREVYLELLVAAPPTFGFAVDPASLTLAPGGSGQVSVAIAPQNGFSGTVTLSLVTEGGQAFTLASLSPSSFSVSGSEPVVRSVTVSASQNAPAGQYALKVRASGGGVVKEAPFTLTITPPPSFTLGVNPSSISGRPGETKTVTLAVSSHYGFSGRVNLSLVDGSGNAAAGFTLSPTSVDVAANALTLTDLAVSIGSGVAPGTYSLQVKGTSADGSVVKTAPLTVTVSPPPSFTLSVSPASLSVAAGETATFSVAVAPQNGFAGTVFLQLLDASGSAVPWASLSPSRVEVPGGEDPVVQQITLAVADGTPAGTYDLILRAESGSITRTKAITVVVQ